LFFLEKRTNLRQKVDLEEVRKKIDFFKNILKKSLGKIFIYYFFILLLYFFNNNIKDYVLE
jgi:hypothetical protein